jgi:putative Holliday junction resolvase
MRGRRLAFDYGDTRIGVAVCDADGILATPLPYIENKVQTLSTVLAGLFSEYEPIQIFVGLPITMSGASGEAVEKVRDFAKKLESDFDGEIIFVDERLSTVSAQRKLKDAGVSSKESKSLIDSMSAVAILEQGLLHRSTAITEYDETE